MVKNLPAVQENKVQSLGLEVPLGREWQPISIFLPGESHGQRSLAGYSLWGLKELDTAEQLTCTHTHSERKHKTPIIGFGCCGDWVDGGR